jgi:UDP-N-acetylmuramoyl-tripeptide--D-alanyl-D-alanine ligase
MTDPIKTIFNLFLRNKKVTIDSRNVPEGSVFFGIRGDNFNGNEFAENALQNGAICSVVDDHRFVKNENFILVDDSLTSLQELAKMYRQSLSAIVIGITGSNGKTTTKELIREVLSTTYKTRATVGNLNNHLGVPLTLLSLPSDLDYVIIEMGANHVGEIQKLCEIAQPDFGIITNIGKAHLGEFGGFEGVKKAKSELYNYIKKVNGEIFMNTNNSILSSLSNGMRKITYGSSDEVYCKGELAAAFPFVQIRTEGQEINSKLIGAYNFENLLAACCIGKYFNVDAAKIKKAIESYIPANNRSQIIKTDSNTVIMDAYNANPSSMDAAITNFAESHYKNKILILGEMLELGDESKSEHIALLNKTATCEFEKIFLTGHEYKGISDGDMFIHFDSTEKLASFLSQNKLLGKTILVKGSRGNRLEKIQQYL